MEELTTLSPEITESQEINQLSSEIPRIEINPRTIRFSEAPWYIPKIPVLIGGAGGIGSWLSLYLARQDLDIYIYDFDSLDETNLGGQWYQTNQLNLPKTSALSQNIKSFTGNDINTYDRYNEDSMSNPIVFSAFDNMEARKLMFDKWEKDYALNPKYFNKACVFIDGRLLAESGKVFTVTRHNASKYREYLYTDAEIKEQPCSFKATSHAAGIIAGLMTASFNNYTTNVKEGMLIRETPFLTEFELPLMTFENTN